MNVQIYLLYVCFLFLAYFFSDFAKSRINYLIIFVFSLIGFWLSAFYPAEIVTGTTTILVSPTVTNAVFITTELTLLNSALMLLFIMSAIMSMILWLNFIEKNGNKF